MKRESFEFCDYRAVTMTNYEEKWAKIYQRGHHFYVVVTNFNVLAYPDFLSTIDKHPSLPFVDEVKNYQTADMSTVFVHSNHIYDDIASALNSILGKQRIEIIHQGEKKEAI